jgi:multidrug efflux system membrane fusion protein
VEALLNRISWLTLLVASLFVAGCIKPAQQPAAADAPKPPEVYVDVPSTGEITDYEDFTGRTVAVKTIDIRARVTGYLDKINFKEKEGQDVERGFVLFEIDPRPYEAEVARAEAGLLQAESHVKRLELDYKRAKMTVATKTISQEQFDQVAGDRNEALANIDVAKANLKIAKLNLGFTKLHAPISGRVSRTQLDPGNLVRADETILTTIVAMEPMYAYFEVDERTMLRLRRYAEEGRIKLGSQPSDKAVPVTMGLADEEGRYPHDGFVNFVDNRLDPATGTLQVRGIFKNSDRVLSPGLFVRVRLPIGESYKALLVSEKALGTDQGQKFVYVIDHDNLAQYRRVQVGKLQQGLRVILHGLSDGERVVVSGLQRVRPGAPVQPKPMATTAEPSREQSSEVAEAPAAGSGVSQQ